MKIEQNNTKYKAFTLLLASFFYVAVAFANFPPPCNNLLENADFEDGLNHWTLTGEGSASFDSETASYVAELCGDNASSLGQVLPTQAGWEYRAIISGKAEGESGAFARLRFLDENYSPIDNFDQPLRSQVFRSKEFVTEELYSKAPANAAYVHLLLWKENAGCLYVDNLELCEGIPQPEFWANLNAKYDIVVEAEEGMNGAVVTFGHSFGSPCTGNVVQTEGLASGSLYPIGTTSNCFDLITDCGVTDQYCFDVIVEGTGNSLPDLSISYFSTSSFLRSGRRSTFRYGLINENVAVENPLVTNIWLSSDETLEPNTDILVAYITRVEGIDVETITFLQEDAIIPAEFPTGEAYLIMKVDGYDQEEETNEDNNIIVQSITIQESDDQPCTNSFATGTIECSEYLPDGSMRVVSNDNNQLTETIFNEFGVITATQDLGVAIASTLSVENNILIKRDANGNVLEQTTLSAEFQNYEQVEKAIEVSNGYVFGGYLPVSNAADVTFVLIKTDANTNILNTQTYPSPGGFLRTLAKINDDRFVAIYNERTLFQASNIATLMILDNNLEEKWTKVINTLSGATPPALPTNFRKTTCGTFYFQTSGGSGGGGGGFSFIRNETQGYYVFEGDSLRLLKNYSQFVSNSGFGSNYSLTTSESFYGLATDGGILRANESYNSTNILPPFGNYLGAKDSLFLSKEVNGTATWTAIKSPFLLYPFNELIEIGNHYYLLNENTETNQVTLTQVDCDNNGRGTGPLPDIVITAVDLPSVIYSDQGSVQFTITYENQGMATYEGILSSGISVGGANLGLFSSPPVVLAPGESYTHELDHSLYLFAGIRDIDFYADMYDFIEESNETNNRFTITDIEFYEAGSIDLELEVYQTIENPVIGDEYTVVVKVENKGLDTAEEVGITILKPEEVVYTGSEHFTTNGTFYANDIGYWQLDPLEPGSSARILIYYKMTNGTMPQSYAEVDYSNIQDIDSRPGNGTPFQVNEDDEATTASTGDCNLEVNVTSVTCTPENDEYTRVTFAYDITGNTPGDWLSQFAFGLNQGGAPDLNFVGGSVPGAGIGQVFIPAGETSVEQAFWIPSFNCGDAVELVCPGVILTDGIDLELSLVQNSDSPTSFSNYEVVATIVNAGEDTATDIAIDFSKPEGVVYVGSDPYTLSQGSFSPFGTQKWSIPSLAPGATATLSVNYFLLRDNAPVAYAQVIAANEQDVDSTPGNGTPPIANEDDEANTETVIITLLPDLAISNLTVSDASIAPGQELEYFFDLGNIGNANIEGDFNVKAWISVDETISADDIQDGIIPTGNFNAGFSVMDIRGASLIPANLAAGSYYLILKVDGEEEISENSEFNNIISTIFIVSNGTNDLCSEISVQSSANTITISNTNTPHVIKKVFTPSWDIALNCLDDECDDPSVVSGLEPGNYFVSIKLMDDDWNTICDYEEYIEVASTLQRLSPNASLVEATPARPIELKSIQPNPTKNGTVSLLIHSQEEGAYRLECYNSMAQLETNYLINLNEGWNQINLNISKLTGGIYYFHLPGYNWRKMPIKMVVIRD